ncbi:MAG: hypothetical protein GX977_12590 [Firmicutes bacterium]|nr:hypothetical protein [Bacillota bacterium]
MVKKCILEGTQEVVSAVYNKMTVKQDRHTASSAVVLVVRPRQPEVEGEALDSSQKHELIRFGVS